MESNAGEKGEKEAKETKQTNVKSMVGKKIQYIKIERIQSKGNERKL